MEKKFINVWMNPIELFDYCERSGFLDEGETLDEWFDNGGELQFFEGDPDIIKIDGGTGFFCECGDTVFYWFDTWEDDAEDLLRRFFEGIQTGVKHGYSYMTGKMHESIKMAEKQSWEEFDKIENGIAWRGGAGYHYTIFEDVKEENKLQTA